MELTAKQKALQTLSAAMIALYPHLPKWMWMSLSTTVTPHLELYTSIGDPEKWGGSDHTGMIEIRYRENASRPLHQWTFEVRRPNLVASKEELKWSTMEPILRLTQNQVTAREAFQALGEFVGEESGQIIDLPALMPELVPDVFS